MCTSQACLWIIPEISFDGLPFDRKSSRSWYAHLPTPQGGVGATIFVGVRLAVPSWYGRVIGMKRVRQAVPLQPGRQSRWPFVKSYVLRGTRGEESSARSEKTHPQGGVLR
jgi:hypothetical protein